MTPSLICQQCGTETPGPGEQAVHEIAQGERPARGWVEPAPEAGIPDWGRIEFEVL